MFWLKKGLVLGGLTSWPSKIEAWHVCVVPLIVVDLENGIVSQEFAMNLLLITHFYIPSLYQHKLLILFCVFCFEYFRHIETMIQVLRLNRIASHTLENTNITTSTVGEFPGSRRLLWCPQHLSTGSVCALGWIEAWSGMEQVKLCNLHACWTKGSLRCFNWWFPMEIHAQKMRHNRFCFFGSRMTNNNNNTYCNMIML